MGETITRSIFEPEPVELGRVIGDPRRVGLVRHNEDGFIERPQNPRQLFIERRDSIPHIDDKQEQAGLIDRRAGLLEDVHGDNRLVIGHDTARVDQPESAPLPFGLTVDAVARDPGQVADDRAPRPDHPVKDGRFPDIRAANDGDDGKHGTPGLYFSLRFL
jgi:hypothetical protein